LVDKSFVRAISIGKKKGEDEHFQHPPPKLVRVPETFSEGGNKKVDGREKKGDSQKKFGIFTENS